MAKEDLTQVSGVGKITADRLDGAGIRTIAELARADVARISTATGFPESRSALIKEAAQAISEEQEIQAPSVVEAPDQKKVKKKPKKVKKDKEKKKPKKDKKVKKPKNKKKEKKKKKGKKSKKGKKT